jgi:uncharacterized protein
MLRQRLSAVVSSNKKIVEAHTTAKSPSEAAEYLADDIEWIEWGEGVPATGVRTRGKAAFIQNFGDDELSDEVIRMIEENNVVVLEGVAHVHKKDGRNFAVRYCNIFELENGKIKRKSSFAALLKDGT